ncbi:MAG TPA: putative glycoside hydrolase [Gemmatimonadaceae bacterium]
MKHFPIFAYASLIALLSSATHAQPVVRTYAPLPRPDTVRGLYVNRWAVLDQRIWRLVQVAETTEVNTLVIDVKDDRGYVLYRSKVPLARDIGADTTNPVPASRIRALLDTMRANGIHAIARIVVAKDPLLARARESLAVKRKADGKPWLDANQQPWLDPTHREVWTYAADLAAEAVAMGFSEVQYDYVRFPDDPRLAREATFPLAKRRARARVIRDQLAYLEKRTSAMQVPMAIDVFGLTTSDTTDMGIGQSWEQFAPQVDIVQPMTYPSHYSTGMYGFPNPNAEPYGVIDRALKAALARNAKLAHPPLIVPWYQDFTLGTPKYGPEQVRAQIQAGYDNGVASWLLWNPGSSYTIDALRPKSKQ